MHCGLASSGSIAMADKENSPSCKNIFSLQKKKGFHNMLKMEVFQYKL